MANYNGMSFEEILNYPFSYGVSNIVNKKDIFYLIKNKKDKDLLNEYIDFIKKKLIEEMNFFSKGIDVLIKSGNLFFIQSNDDQVNLSVSSLAVIGSLVYCYTVAIPNYEFSNLSSIEIEIGKLRAVINDIKKILHGLDKVEAYQKINKLYPFFEEHIIEYANRKGINLKAVKKDLLLMSNKELIKSRIENIINTGYKLINDIQNSIDFFSKAKIDVTKVLDDIKSIDKEVFAFYIAANNLKNNFRNEDMKTNITDNSIYNAINFYLDFKDKNTNKFKVRLEEFKIREYTFKEFEKDIGEYIKRHPEIRVEKINENYFKGWNVDEIDDFLSALSAETLEYFDEVDANRLFIPYSKGNNKKKKENDENPNKRVKNETEENNRLVIEKRVFYAKNIHNIFKTLLGKDKFKGYIANIFKNGIVIFEKYDVTLDNISTKPGAAYIMTIDNFNKLCTLSIQEIRELSNLVRNDEESGFGFVDYRTHRGDWQNYLQDKIDMDTGTHLGKKSEINLG